MATTVASTVVTFESTDVAVDVTTVSMPPMSFAMRLCTSPVRVPREEGERQPLQMAIDGSPQVVHDRLADLVREQRLEDADDAGHDRDRDHARHERRQQAEINIAAGLLRERGVEHLAQKEGGHDADRRGDDDQAADDRKAGPVVAEEREDAAQIRPAHSRVGRPHGRVGGGVVA